MKYLLQLLCSAALCAGDTMLSGAAMAQTPPAPAPLALTAETFAKLPNIEDPDISPDGTRIAARIAVGDKLYFAVLPIDTGKANVIGSGDMQINGWHWVNDDWVVVTAGMLLPVEMENWYVSRAFGVSATSQKIVPLVRDAAQNADDVLWYARDGSPRVLLSYQTSIYSNNAGFWPKVVEIDVTNGKQKAVVASHEGVMGWYADGSGFVRMGLGQSNEGRDVRLLYRKPGDSLFHTVQRTKTANHDLVVPALFLPDPTKALMYDDDDKGFSALYELDLNTLERGKQVIGTPGYDLGGLVTDESGSGYVGFRTRAERRATRWTDPDMAAADKVIGEHVHGGGAITIVSVDRKRNRFVFHVGSADSPGAYFVYDRAQDDVKAIDFVNRDIRLRRLNPVQTIHYKARDGLDIPAVLTLPMSGAKTGLPLIVMPHGGPFARDEEGWDWWAQFLASKGYAVVQPNYRGSSGYGTEFAKRGEGQWGLAMQDDLNDAVKALAELGIADPKRVCMVGGSYGGYAAVRAAQRDGALYRCAVSFAGIGDMNAMLRYNRRFLNSGAGTDWTRLQAPDLKAVSPLNFVEQFSIPLLLVHGAKDQVVEVRQSRNLNAKLKAAGKAVEYIEQPEGDHHLSRYADRLQFLKALEAFLAKHNPA